MLDYHVYAYSADRPPSFTCSIRRLTRGVHSSILLLQGKRLGYVSRSIEIVGTEPIEEMGELLAISQPIANSHRETVAKVNSLNNELLGLDFTEK